MSHVTEIKVEILDLESLAKAAERCGCELITNKKTYHWYGYSVGDYPLPKGFKAEDLGHCDHAIRVQGGKEGYTYEIGVCKRRDGKEGYTLLIDFFAGGHGLIEKIGGNDAAALTDWYSAEAAASLLEQEGFSCSLVKSASGEIEVEARK